MWKSKRSKDDNYTTVEPLNYLLRSRSMRTLVFWSFMTVASFTAVIGTCTALVMKYQRQDTNVLTKLTDGRFSSFPAVTLCNLNPYKRSVLSTIPPAAHIIKMYEINLNSIKSASNQSSHDRQLNSNLIGKHVATKSIDNDESKISIEVKRFKRSDLKVDPCRCNNTYATTATNSSFSSSAYAIYSNSFSTSICIFKCCANSSVGTNGRPAKLENSDSSRKLLIDYGMMGSNGIAIWVPMRCMGACEWYNTPSRGSQILDSCTQQEVDKRSEFLGAVGISFDPLENKVMVFQDWNDTDYKCLCEVGAQMTTSTEGSHASNTSSAATALMDSNASASSTAIATVLFGSSIKIAAVLQDLMMQVPESMPTDTLISSDFTKTAAGATTLWLTPAAQIHQNTREPSAGISKTTRTSTESRNRAAANLSATTGTEVANSAPTTQVMAFTYSTENGPSSTENGPNSKEISPNSTANSPTSTENSLSASTDTADSFKVTQNQVSAPLSTQQSAILTDKAESTALVSKISTEADQKTRITSTDSVSADASFFPPTLEQTSESIINQTIETILGDPTVKWDQNALSATAVDVLEYVMGQLPEEQVIEAGYDRRETIMRSFYNNGRLAAKNFTLHTDPNYGNCYTFNLFGSNMVSNQPGSENGFSVAYLVGEEEYLPFIQSFGLRVVIHEQGDPIFPDLNGYSVASRTRSSISLKKSKIATRKEMCAATPSDAHDYVFEEGRYTVEACLRSCHQTGVIEKCKCGDPRIPLPTNSSCLSMSIVAVVVAHTQHSGSCVDAYYNNTREPECHCPHECELQFYEASLSTTVWSSGYDTSGIFASSEYGKNFTRKYGDCRKNMAMIDVYLESLTTVCYLEVIGYTMSDLLWDMSSAIGFLTGMSVISIFETINCMRFLWQKYRKQ